MSAAPRFVGAFLRSATKVETNLDPAGMNARATGAEYVTEPETMY
jgi:hypothetical protein